MAMRCAKGPPDGGRPGEKAASYSSVSPRRQRCMQNSRLRRAGQPRACNGRWRALKGAIGGRVVRREVLGSSPLQRLTTIDLS